MAAYCSQDDLVASFGEAELLANADRDGDGVVDAGIVDAAIVKASSIIDSYIGARYALPLLSVPASIRSICEDLTRHVLYTVEPMKIVIDNRDAAIARLKDISRGVAILDAPAPAAAPAAASGNEILFDAGDRGVSRAELRKL